MAKLPKPVFEAAKKIYEEDLANTPTYPDGKPRPSFEALPYNFQKTWAPKVAQDRGQMQVEDIDWGH